jgi:hypothetical protein
MAYNLLGQQGPKGSRNPDPNLSDDVATYMYDFPPGQGDNKGATKTNQPVAKKEVEEKKVEVALENPNSYIASKPEVEKKVSNITQDTKSVDIDSAINNASGKIRTLTAEEYNEFKKIPIEEKRIKIAELAAANIFFRAYQKEDLEKTYRITAKEFDEAVDIGITGEIETIESGPLNSGVNTWWQLLGYESLDEVNKEIASGALTAPEIRRAKDNAEEKRTGGSVTPKMFGPPEMQDIITTVTVSKGGKILEILESDLHLYKKAGWSTDIGADTSNADTSNADTSNADTSVVVDNEETIGETQVVVYGPNGARTTANTFKRPGEEMSEYDRLIAGLIPGREGYKGATKSEPLTADYPGDYGGEDASTPMDQRESVVGIGNTDYDSKDYSSVGQPIGYTVTPTVNGQPTGEGSKETSTEIIDFNNVPKGAKLADVDGKLYLIYAVPGQGQLYTGNTMYMAYEVVGNDVFSAGLLTEGATAPTANHTMDKTFFDTVAIVAGNTNQIIGIEDDPFASFVETYSEEAQLRPWLLDPEFIALQAEAAIENRDISDTEWRLTNWYQTHNQAERAWMDLELSDPAEAARQLNDLEIFYENQLSSLGVSGVPDGLVQWISSKNISGQWSDTYTAEQLKLFSDPYKSGDRDAELQNLISTSGFGDVDRTAAREREVVELYRKWLGPTLGSLTQDEVASIAGRLRDDPDYEDALIQNLKQNRLAAFSNYTNPELTYEDIARPWRNLTTSVWGQTADETQGWWQEMVKTNDFAKAQETLRTKGLEQNVTQVTQDATKALQKALGQGQISQLGVNV